MFKNDYDRNMFKYQTKNINSVEVNSNNNNKYHQKSYINNKNKLILTGLKFGLIISVKNGNTSTRRPLGFKNVFSEETMSLITLVNVLES